MPINSFDGLFNLRKPLHITQLNIFRHVNICIIRFNPVEQIRDGVEAYATSKKLKILHSCCVASHRVVFELTLGSKNGLNHELQVVISNLFFLKFQSSIVGSD